MSVGLYDIDFALYTHVVFNLELMKLSTYYKRKREVTVMTPFFEPEKYTTFIVRKDYDDGEFDKKIFESNVQYGGHAFTGKNYIKLPEEIEICKPDKEIYIKFKDKFCDSRNHTKIFNNMMNLEHARISLDGKKVWDDVDRTYQVNKTTNGIIFHDYDLNSIEDGYEKVKEILNNFNEKIIKSRIVGMKFPVQLYSVEDYEKWTSLSPSLGLFSMKYNGYMENEMFNHYINNSAPGMLKQLEYNITYGCKNQEEFINNRLSNIYKQILLAISNNKIVKLTYDDNFFINDNWEKLINLINFYIMKRTNYYNFVKRNNYYDNGKYFTLFRYITTPKLFTFKNFPYTIEELREIFSLVREKNYETFKMFYELAQVELKGGQIIERI